ncbi:F-box only protein 15 [Desmophyllum pertusum]|uniref:F-box only protein 15 n=1 Tax=Desmophyllum pertusum TaxID=174260 RepID=A0A9W9YPG7_9CNID|nr:F-box only protein 15 [Desmophyllum pertusum]
MSQHQKHLSSYLKSKRSGPTTAGGSKDRKTLVGVRPSPTKQVGKTHVPTYSRFKVLDLYRFPDELLLKIFKYLSPSELLVCAQVCHKWSTVSRESSLWQWLLPKLPKRVRDSLTFKETKEEGFDWKSEMIKRCINARNEEILKLQISKKLSPYTGLSTEVPHALRLGDVRWKLCITDTSGKEHWSSADCFNLFESSLCVRWYSLQLPSLSRLKTLRVFAFVPIFFHRNWKSHVNSATTRSLILQQDLRSKGVMLSQEKAVSESGMITAHIICPSILATCWSASWKDGGELAFITLCLHHRDLTRRVLLGSHDRTFVPPPHQPVPDDIDPKYGLHGYRATIELRNHKATLWGQQYREMYQQYVSDSYVCLGDPGHEHGSFQKRLSLPWKTELFKGILPDMCFLDVTVLHGRSVPFWCFSSPVKIVSNKAPDGDFSSEGEKLFIEYSDEHGSIRLDFIFTMEDEGRAIVTNVEVRLLKSFVNSWFNTRH